MHRFNTSIFVWAVVFFTLFCIDSVAQEWVHFNRLNVPGDLGKISAIDFDKGQIPVIGLHNNGPGSELYTKAMLISDSTTGDTLIAHVFYKVLNLKVINGNEVILKKGDYLLKYHLGDDKIDTILYDNMLSWLSPADYQQMAINESGSVIAFDRYGETVISGGQAYYFEGLGTYQDDSLHLFAAPNYHFIGGWSIFDIEVDRMDRVWVSCPGNGLTVYDKGVLTNYNAQNSPLNTNGIWDLQATADKSVWIGTSLGVTKFDGVSWESYILPDSSGVGSLAEDNDGSLWLQASEEVIYHYDFNNFIRFDKYTTPLPLDQAHGHGRPIQISVDSFGNKWFPTKEGLYIYRKGGVIIPGDSTINENEEVRLSVFPSPVADRINVLLEIDQNNHYTVRLISINGGILGDLFDGELVTGKYTHNFDLVQYSPGVYLIQVYKGGAPYATAKFVKL